MTLEVLDTPVQDVTGEIYDPVGETDAALATAITKAASKQTYYTIRLLADFDRTEDAYRAYAYFRWVDDWLDQTISKKSECISFAKRQQELVNRCYRSEAISEVCPYEALLVDLIRADAEKNGGLQAYIRNMMAVMIFDANRRGRLISQAELDEYSRHLATGVTEALHYFIGHDDYAPRTDARYLAVTGAHITHMLRDTIEDVTAGYFNIPREVLEAHQLEPGDFHSTAYRAWVQSRVQLARQCFEAGKAYLAQVKNLRCRLAGYAYMARFEGVLDAIEREDYHLRAQYLERKGLRGGLHMFFSTLSMFCGSVIRG